MAPHNVQARAVHIPAHRGRGFQVNVDADASET